MSLRGYHDDFPVTAQARRASSAFSALSLMLAVAACAFGCWVVGTRPLDTGTDTQAYAAFFLRLGQGAVETRLEPGFVFFSEMLRRAGLDVVGYQVALFALMLGTVVVSTRKYFDYLRMERDYLGLFCASLAFLYLSPMFVNASINAIRQGLSALLVFAALLGFAQRRWWQFALWGALGASLHTSALLYLACAPALLPGARWLRFGAFMAFVLYCTGLSRTLVQTLSPTLYAMAMEYSPSAEYRAGVRIDFAVFSIFWYALPYLLGPLIQARYRETIQQSSAVYLVMLLPFFAIGWGNYSNRYLLPGWLAVSLILAAVVCCSRIGPLRHPLTVRLGLVAACAVFYYLVVNVIVI